MPPGFSPKDPKTQLQERLQAAARPFAPVRAAGGGDEDHAKVFEVACILAEPALRTCAKANSRRGAEQLAAEAALQQLERERHEQR